MGEPHRPAASPQPRKRWVLAAIVMGPTLLFGGCIALFVTAGDGEYSAEQITESVIETCQDDVRSSLRDPDSARFSDWRAWEMGTRAPKGMPFDAGAGDKLYSAAGMVSAKNAFGGYTGDTPYGCDAVVRKNGEVQARAVDASGVLDSP